MKLAFTESNGATCCCVIHFLSSRWQLEILQLAGSNPLPLHDCLSWPSPFLLRYHGCMSKTPWVVTTPYFQVSLSTWVSNSRLSVKIVLATDFQAKRSESSSILVLSCHAGRVNWLPYRLDTFPPNSFLFVLFVVFRVFFCCLLTLSNYFNNTSSICVVSES
jgi:hypothetical protein